VGVGRAGDVTLGLVSMVSLPGSAEDIGGVDGGGVDAADEDDDD